MKRNLVAVAMLVAVPLTAQVSLPPSGDNQKASVTQHIGPVTVTVDYSSPDVHGPDGADRRGKIWGELVPFGMTNLGVGGCTECPWRAGANENTVITVSDDVLVEGKPLPAGRYGFHVIPGADQATLIFSKDADAWGSYFYDATRDALRVTVKPEKNEYREWLTFEFVDRRPDKAVLELQWEDLAIPMTITVPDVKQRWLAGILRDINGSAAFSSEQLANAAEYALNNRLALKEAEQWAFRSAYQPFGGMPTWRNLSLLARLYEANGKADEAKKAWDEAYRSSTATPLDLHRHARVLQNSGDVAGANRVYELNAKLHPEVWPTNVGLMRMWSARGDYKKAAAYGRKALAQAPDELNRKAIADSIAKLEKKQPL